MKLLPDLWIAHPAADGCPVGLWRWMLWKYAEMLGAVVGKLDNHVGRVHWRALYGENPDDDVPF